MTKLLVLLVACLAGAASTVLEVVWIRWLIPVLGNSVPAIGAAGAAYMAGHSLGAFLAPRVFASIRPWGPLCGCCVIAAIAALFVPALAHSGFADMARIVGAIDFEAGRLGLRFLCAFALLLVPATLVGSVLPLLGRVRPRSGRWLGLLCGSYSLGACAGVVCASFLLLELVGVSGANGTAVAILMVCGAICYLCARAKSGVAPGAVGRTPAVEGAAAPAAPVSSSLPTVRLLVLLSFLTGCSTLAYEVTWPRITVYLLGNDHDAVGFFLGTILAGMTVGGVLHAAVLFRGDSRRVLAGLQWTLFVSVILGWRITGEFYVASGVYVIQPFDDPRWNLICCRLIHAFVLLFVPSVAMGASFPLIGQMLERRRPSGFAVAVAWSSLGAVAGALLPPTFGLAWFGVQGTLMMICALPVGVAILLLPRRSTPLRLGLLMAAVAIAFVVLPRNLIREMTGRQKDHARLLYYEEGRTGTVSVWQDRIDHTRRLYINQISEVPTNPASIHVFKLLGHLPLLVHEEARRILMITFGGGIAAGAVASHVPKQLDVVDIEGGVFGAAPWFEEENHRVLARSFVHDHIADGRQFLASRETRYDVIISDSTHPRSADSWVLYTLEFYRLCRSRLLHGGVFAQWLPMHGLNRRAYEIVLRTFREVFPQCSLWFVKEYTVLLGSTEPFAIDISSWREQLEDWEVRADLEIAHLGTLEELLGCFVLGPDGVRRLASGSDLNTDDFPLIQFEPLVADAFPDIAAPIRKWRERVTDHLRGLDGEQGLDGPMRQRLEEIHLAHERLLQGRSLEAAELAPWSTRLAIYAREDARRADHLLERRRYYPDDLNLIAQAVPILMSRGLFSEAADALARGVDQKPDAAGLWYLLGVASIQAGRTGPARTALERALELDPDLEPAKRALKAVEAAANR